MANVGTIAIASKGLGSLVACVKVSFVCSGTDARAENIWLDGLVRAVALKDGSTAPGATADISLEHMESGAKFEYTNIGNAPLEIIPGSDGNAGPFGAHGHYAVVVANAVSGSDGEFWIWIEGGARVP